MIDRFILRDSADSQFDDLIIFDKEVKIEDIVNKIEELKKENEYYTNEDVYDKLSELGKYTIEWIGQYDIIEY